MFAILSVKTTLASKTPSFLDKSEAIFLAHPISQVIPEILKESSFAFAATSVFSSLEVSSFFVSFLHPTAKKLIKVKANIIF